MSVVNRRPRPIPSHGQSRRHPGVASLCYPNSGVVILDGQQSFKHNLTLYAVVPVRRYDGDCGRFLDPPTEYQQLESADSLQSACPSCQRRDTKDKVQEKLIVRVANSKMNYDNELY